MSICSQAPNSAQIQVSANGVYTIPTDLGIKLVRDLFEGIGVDRLRADSGFAHLSFEDVSELHDTYLTEAIAIGLDYMTDPEDDRSGVKEALLKRLDAQFPRPVSHPFVYRVGRSYSKAWPTQAR
jgi:hypothetical protein